LTKAQEDIYEIPTASRPRCDRANRCRGEDRWWHHHSRHRPEIDGVEYLIMKESDIMGVLVEAEAKKKAA
jgi:hypothetical protein